MNLSIFQIFQSFYAFYLKVFCVTEVLFEKCLDCGSHFASTFIWDHPFNTYAKFAEKLTFLTTCYAHNTFVYQVVRNGSFSENFVYVINA